MKNWTYNKKYFILDKNGENIEGEKFNCKEKLNSAINEFTKSVNKEINESNKGKTILFVALIVIISLMVLILMYFYLFI